VRNMSIGLSKVLLNFYRVVVTIRTAKLSCISAVFFLRLAFVIKI